MSVFLFVMFMLFVAPSSIAIAMVGLMLASKYSRALDRRERLRAVVIVPYAKLVAMRADLERSRRYSQKVVRW